MSNQGSLDAGSTEVIVNEMQMLGGRSGAGAPAKVAEEAAVAPTADFDDDIPF